MISKPMKFFISLSLGIFLSVWGYIGAEERCEVEVDKGKPIYTTQFNQAELKRDIKRIEVRDRITTTKAKGRMGELVAREVIEDKLRWDGVSRVSIITMFQEFGCQAEEYMRDEADRGIDDIFVVLRADGWIDQRYYPIFHEAKYDGRCRLILKDTATLCQQLSINWIDGNLGKARTRTAARICFDDQNEMEFQTCKSCKKMFQENITWLAQMLGKGLFFRTASVLCESGAFSLYTVDK
ncbi:MAG: hypothetical protein FJX71_03365 [Alphaproteobacteria bacterium]|nr:hypothetical protein [Alphaproteobacteria bacterium]